MRTILYIAILACTFLVESVFSQDTLCMDKGCDFKTGDKVYVFGNNAKLRSAPKTESDVLELLKIGEWVEIIEKTEYSWPYKGYDSPFYKVKYDMAEGYILGGLLAIERKEIAGQPYFFALSKERENTFLNIRHIGSGTYIEQKIPISHTNFDILLLGNKGLYQLDDVLLLDYKAEACGMEGGGVYLFAQGGMLHNIGMLHQVSEAGVFSSSERFIFPNDEGGSPDMVWFKKETHHFLDEESDWEQTTMETRKLRWSVDHLTPDFRQKAAN